MGSVSQWKRRRPMTHPLPRATGARQGQGQQAVRCCVVLQPVVPKWHWATTRATTRPRQSPRPRHLCRRRRRRHGRQQRRRCWHGRQHRRSGAPVPDLPRDLPREVRTTTASPACALSAPDSVDSAATAPTETMGRIANCPTCRACVAVSDGVAAEWLFCDCLRDCPATTHQ